MQQFLLWSKGKGQSAPLLHWKGMVPQLLHCSFCDLLAEGKTQEQGMGIPKGTQITALTTAGSCFPKNPKSSSSEHVMRD